MSATRTRAGPLLLDIARDLSPKFTFLLSTMQEAYDTDPAIGGLVTLYIRAQAAEFCLQSGGSHYAATGRRVYR